MNWPRPLDPLRSFKAKTGLLVGASLLLASLTFWITTQWQFRYALLAALIGTRGDADPRARDDLPAARDDRRRESHGHR